MAANERTVLNVEGEKVALGPIRRDLSETYRRWMNDFETVRTLGRLAKPVTEEEQLQWIEKVTKPGNTENVTFTVYARDSAGWQPIGCAGLHEIDLVHGTSSFGIVLGEAPARGHGLGTEATRLVADYGFTVLGLHNILLTVHASNPGAIRCYENAGFKHIGRRRGARRLGAERGDMVFMDLLSTEFTSPVLAKVFRPTPVK